MGAGAKSPFQKLSAPTPTQLTTPRPVMATRLVGWENMTTKEVGQIGGKVGGKIGGQMVRELISMAESQMAPVAEEAVSKAAADATLEGG